MKSYGADVVVEGGATRAESVRRGLSAVPDDADVIIVPHLRTPFTESLDPIKAYECRAVGRPVVATDVAGFRDLGPPVVVAEAGEFGATFRVKPSASTTEICFFAGLLSASGYFGAQAQISHCPVELNAMDVPWEAGSSTSRASGP